MTSSISQISTIGDASTSWPDRAIHFCDLFHCDTDPLRRLCVQELYKRGLDSHAEEVTTEQEEFRCRARCLWNLWNANVNHCDACCPWGPDTWPVKVTTALLNTFTHAYIAAVVYSWTLWNQSCHVFLNVSVYFVTPFTGFSECMVWLSGKFPNIVLVRESVEETKKYIPVAASFTGPLAL